MKIKMFIMAVMAMMSVAMPAAAAAPALEELVAESEKVFPLVLDQGSTLEAVKLAPDAVEVHLVLAVPAAQFPMMQQNLGMMRPTMLKMLVSDANMKKLLGLASDDGLGLRFLIICRDDRSANVALEYSADELTAAVK